MKSVLEWIRERYPGHESEPDRGFAFVPNVIRLEPDPLQVCERLVLRSANQKEAEELGYLVGIAAAPNEFRNPWDTSLEWDREVGKGHAQVLASGETRYHVAAFENSMGNEVYQLLEASVLAKGPELELGLILLTGSMFGGGSARSGLRRVRKRTMFDDAAFDQLDVSDAADLVEMYAKWMAHDNDTLDLGGAVADYLGLREIPERHNLRFLGYFAILEALLTHKPKPGDPYDSITRQVTTKTALLEKRYERPFQYPDFGGMSRDKVWKRLYGLRSQVAHGGRPDFNGKEFTALGSMAKAEGVLRDTLRAVLRQGLEEPTLLVDLRLC